MSTTGSAHPPHVRRTATTDPWSSTEFAIQLMTELSITQDGSLFRSPRDLPT